MKLRSKINFTELKSKNNIIRVIFFCLRKVLYISLAQLKNDAFFSMVNTERNAEKGWKSMFTDESWAWVRTVSLTSGILKY